MKTNHIRSIVTAWLLLFLLSCSARSGKEIVGKWQEIGGTNARMEFFQDGNVTIVAGGRQLAGKYEFLDNKRLKIDYGANVGAMIFEVSINGDQMVLKEPNGEVSTFKKVK